MIQIQKFNLYSSDQKTQMDVNEIFFIGHNKYGQAGTGEEQHNKKHPQPKDIIFKTFIKQVSCGNHHSALLTIDGLIYTMGSNIHGTLGLGNCGNINYAFKPTLVKEIKDVDQVVSGSYHMCAIRQGELYTWGKGIDGQLGHGNMKNVFVPTRVQALGSDVESVSCGLNHTLVIVNSQSSEMNGYSFGSGIYGQLGCGSNRSFNHPVNIKLPHIQSVSAGQNHSLFISDGRLFGCGDNTSYQLGQLQDSFRNKKYILQPVKLQTACSQQISLIDCHNLSIALTSKGSFIVWGGRGKLWPPVVLGDEQQIVNFKVANEKVYCINGKSQLISLTFTQANPRHPQEQLLLQNKNVIDMDCGENHLLVVGDIVAQVEEKAQSSTLSLWNGESLATSKKSFSLKHSLQSQSTVKAQDFSKIPLNQQMPEFYFTMHLKSGLSEDQKPNQMNSHSISQFTQHDNSFSRNPSSSETFKTFQNVSSSVEMQSRNPLQINENEGKLCITEHQIMLKNKEKSSDTIQVRQFNAQNTCPSPDTMQFSEMRLQKLMQQMQQKTIHLKKNYPMASGNYIPRYSKSITKTPSSYIKKQPQNFVMGSEQFVQSNLSLHDPKISQFDDRIAVGLELHQTNIQNQNKLSSIHFKDVMKKSALKQSGSQLNRQNKQNEMDIDGSKGSRINGRQDDGRQDEQSIESIFMQLLRKQKSRVTQQNIFHNDRLNQDSTQLPQRKTRLSHSCISTKFPQQSSSTSRVHRQPPSQPRLDPPYLPSRSPIRQSKLTMSKISEHSNISARTNFKKNSELLQISRSNRELRFELRDRNLKISRLQEELSKKEIEMQMLYQQLEYFRHAVVTCRQCGNQSRYEDPFSSN